MQASSASKFLGIDGEAVPNAACDVRARMAVSLIASAVTILISSFEGQLVLFVASLLYALSIRRFKALIVSYLFIAFMMCLATLCTWGISRLAPFLPFTFRGLAVPFMRGLVMLNVVLPLALTCRIQDLLTALKGLHLPFCIYIPGAVMIRFMPTFINDIKQISETLRIRGYDLSLGEMFRHPLLMLRLIFTPLMFRSLRTSEDLGIAAELKGLDAHSHFVPYRSPRWTKRDTILILIALAVVVAALGCHYSFGQVPVAGHR
jgi:energy-coupling factor transport system permease protein